MMRNRSYLQHLSVFFTRALFACILVTTYPMASAHAERSDGFRVAVLGGFTSNATANLRKDGESAILESSDETSAAFGTAFFYGIDGFDLGISVEHTGSGSFQGFSRNRPLGGKARIATVLSWHYVDQQWGSMYLGLSPGLVIMQHNDHLRSQVATILGRQPTQLDGIDHYNAGFSFGTSVGLLFRVTESFSMVIEGQVLVNDVSVQEEPDDVHYLSTQPVLRVGFAAQL